MLPQCDVCVVLLQVLCCCSSLELASETRGAVAGGAVGAVPGPVGSSNIRRRSAGIGRGAAGGAGGALNAGVAEFSGVGLDTSEEQ